MDGVLLRYEKERKLRTVHVCIFPSYRCRRILFSWIMFQPDLGTALIFSFIAMYMFFASPISKKDKETDWYVVILFSGNDHPNRCND